MRHYSTGSMGRAMRGGRSARPMSRSPPLCVCPRPVDCVGACGDVCCCCCIVCSALHTKSTRRGNKASVQGLRLGTSIIAAAIPTLLLVSRLSAHPVSTTADPRSESMGLASLRLLPRDQSADHEGLHNDDDDLTNPTDTARRYSPYGISSKIFSIKRQWKMERAIVPPEARYDPVHKVLMCVSPKAGSSSFFRWLYHVSTAGGNYDRCAHHEHPGQNVHPHRIGPCWASGGDGEHARAHALNLTNPLKLPEEMQRWIMTDPSVMRFAITRDPLDRAISAWKSKLACDGLYHTDKNDRPKFLNMLLQVAEGWSTEKLADPSCMSLLEYAMVLRAIPPVMLRLLAYTSGGPHFAPQSSTCMVGRFPYTHVQSLETMSPTSPSLQTLIARLGSTLERHPLMHKHASALSAKVPDVANATAHHAIKPLNYGVKPMPGATAEDVVQAREILIKVYAEDILSMDTRRRRRRRR
mmetsp:Transcript_30772/g.92272  ORF Transcript_30772/g.92272 Transcript_30772/m.92272 type:complete len:468 (+) Transcript_30772:769-2172(+)